MPDIRRFTPDDREDVRAALEVRNTVETADASWERPTSLDVYTAMLRHGWDGEPDVPYLMCVEGRPVALGALSLPERDNRHLAWASVQVLPEHRRRGHGTALLAHLVEQARAAGRTSLGTEGWESEATLAFADRHGLKRVTQAIQRRQHLADIEPGVVQELYDAAATAARDYELVRVEGRSPADLVDGLVEVTAAINDAPTDDLDIEDDAMSPERLVAYEEACLARRNRIYRLVARHRESQVLAGHTVVVVEQDRPEVGHQHDTAVSRDHRGHRLGLLVKAGMLLWLAEAEPGLETIDTWNAESNEHMIAVNRVLGYRVMGREIGFQKAI